MSIFHTPQQDTLAKQTTLCDTMVGFRYDRNLISITPLLEQGKLSSNKPHSVHEVSDTFSCLTQFIHFPLLVQADFTLTYNASGQTWPDFVWCPAKHTRTMLSIEVLIIASECWEVVCWLLCCVVRMSISLGWLGLSVVRLPAWEMTLSPPPPPPTVSDHHLMSGRAINT